MYCSGELYPAVAVFPVALGCSLVAPHDVTIRQTGPSVQNHDAASPYFREST